MIVRGHAASMVALNIELEGQMRMKETSAAASIAATWLFAAPLSAATFEYVSQQRSVHAQFNFPMQQMSGSQTFLAPDFGPWSATAIANAIATQDSTLGATLLHGNGTAMSSSVNPPNDSSAYSKMLIVFNIAEATPYTLNGAQDTVLTHLDVTGPNNFHIHVEDLVSYHFAGTLQPGQYTLDLFCNSILGSPGNFNMDFALVPSPGPLALGVLSLLSARRRRR